MSSGNNVHTVETEEASIKFVGSLNTDLLDSESEDEEQYDIKIDNNTLSKKPLPERNKPEVPNSLEFDENNLEIKKNQTIIVNGNPVCPDSDLDGLYENEPSLHFSQKDNTDVGRKESEKSVSSNNNTCTNFSRNTQHESNIEVDQTSPVRGETEENLCNMNSVLRRTDSGSLSRPERFNPFDRDVVFEDDHFSTPESGKNQRDSNSTLSPAPRSSRISQSLSSVSDSFSLCSHDPVEEEFSFADLGLAEDHFSRPEGHFGMSTLEELEMAIENCKEMIQEVPQNSERQKTLVRKLVHLRMKYQEYKEGPEPIGPDVRLVVGHRFKQKENRSSKHYCERCNSVIWGVLQVWFRCTECGYHCHAKCLNTITRTCASVRVSENPSYILSICPEKGLANQNYRCAECRAQISFKSGFSEPRLCDYSGNFYCEACHWNDVMVIPARVLHNWDFEPQKVCRAAKQFLKLMTTKAVLRIQDINPMLFNFVEELDDVKKLREEILVMKKYFLSCKAALDSKLLLQLSSRQHCVENSDMYSLRDLIDVHGDLLLPELAKVHSSFAQHIKSDCQLCQAKGFICELCDTHEVLFPFDNIAVVCAQCSYVLHRHCMKKYNMCPRCERRNKRSEQTT